MTQRPAPTSKLPPPPVTNREAAARIERNGKARRAWAMRLFAGVLQARHPRMEWRELNIHAGQAAERVGDTIALRNPDGELADEYTPQEFDALLAKLNFDHATEVLLHALVLLDIPEKPAKGNP